MEVGVGHDKVRPNAAETELAVGPFEGEGMVGRNLSSVHVPLVHAPEVGVVQLHIQRVDDAGDQRQLFGGTDGAADARGIVRRRLSPRVDVLQRLCKVELLESVVHRDRETRPAEVFDVAHCQLRCVR